MVGRASPDELLAVATAGTRFASCLLLARILELPHPVNDPSHALARHHRWSRPDRADPCRSPCSLWAGGLSSSSATRRPCRSRARCPSTTSRCAPCSPSASSTSWCPISFWVTAPNISHRPGGVFSRSSRPRWNTAIRAAVPSGNPFSRRFCAKTWRAIAMPRHGSRRNWLHSRNRMQAQRCGFARTMRWLSCPAITSLVAMAAAAM